jgi:NADH dehydrogenase
LIRAAKTTGASRFVYISAYAHGPAYRQIPFFRLKSEVEAQLRASGLPFTIVRPTAFIDFHAHVLIGTPILEKRRVVLVGRGERPRNFVAADDVARFVVMALGEASLAGEAVDIGGPENLTAMDVVRRYERIAAARARLLHVPRGLAALMSRAARPIHFGLSQVLQTAVAADAADQPFDARPFERRFPIPLTSLDDWMAQHVAAGYTGAPEKPSVPV